MRNRDKEIKIKATDKQMEAIVKRVKKMAKERFGDEMMSKECKHMIIEIYEGKLVINTMDDYCPVNYCPTCGKQVTMQEIYENDKSYYDAIGVKI